MPGKMVVFAALIAGLVQVSLAGEDEEIFIPSEKVKLVAKQMLQEHEDEIDDGLIIIKNVSKSSDPNGGEICTVIQASEKRFVSWSDGEMIAGRSYGFMNPYTNVAFLIQNRPCQ